MAMGRRVWVWGGVAVGVVVVGLVAAGLLMNADAYRGRIEDALTQSLGRKVTLGHLSASVLSGSLVAEAPEVADDPAFSSTPFLTAKEIKIGVEMMPLVLRHELHITGFTIDAPKIVLVRAADGTWNYSSLGGAQNKTAAVPEANNPLPNLTVNKIDITDGTVEWGMRPATAAPREYTGVTVSLENFSFAGPFQFKLSAKLPGDGTLDVKGDAGPIAQGDASLTPVTADVELKHADLAAAGLVDAGAGVGGVADLSAKLVSNGQTAQLQGTLKLTRVVLAKNGTPADRPVEAEFVLNHDLKALTGTVTNASVKVGKAALTATGTYSVSGSVPAVQLKVVGQDMPVDDLAAFVPALGVTLPAGSRLEGGTLALDLAVSGPVGSPVVAGPVKVAGVRLAGFDLGEKLSGIGALTGAKTGPSTTVEVLSSTVHYGPDGIRTDAVDAVVAGLGSATGGGTISPAGALDYRLAVKLGGGVGSMATGAVGLVSGVLGSGGSAKGGIPVKIGGTTTNPTFAPDMGAMEGEVVQKPSEAGKVLGKTLGGLLGR